MKITKQHFADYGNCAESQPFIDYLFGDKDEMDGVELFGLAIAAAHKPPFNMTLEKMQKYLYDPQNYFGDHELFNQFLNIVNSEMVRYSKNVKDSKFIFNSDGLENCHYCYDSKNSKNMLMSSQTDSDGYMIANKPVTQEEFNDTVGRIEEARLKQGQGFDIFGTLMELGYEVFDTDVLNKAAREFFLRIRREP